MLAHPRVINEIDLILKSDEKTELIFNVLIFCDFGRWNQPDIRSFIMHIKEIIKSGHEENRILVSYNPIMVICLSCEFLFKIGDKVNIFKQECEQDMAGL